MNMDIVSRVYHVDYCNEMPFEEFEKELKRGVELLKNSPSTDKLYISRVYSLADQKALNMALEYNEALMVTLLQS